MPPLRFSISLGYRRGEQPPDARTLARYGARAEELGFHAIYVADHFFHRGPMLHAGSAFAVLAGATARLRLGFCAYVLPLRHPIAAARELATLDGLCNGRLVAAFAVGSYDAEFAAFGIPFAERGARLDEGLSALRALWTEPQASFHGRFYDFADVPLEPKPVQRPHPPIWIGSWTGVPRTARRVARIAAGWQASGLHTTIEEVRQGNAAIDRACAEIDRDPASVGRAYVNVITWLGAVPAGTPAPQGPFAGRDSVALVCTPDEAVPKLQALAGAGIQEVSLHFRDWSEEQLAIVAKELMGVG
jgi:probable F420-dependent oxidoreductase